MCDPGDASYTEKDKSCLERTFIFAANITKVTLIC